MSRDSNFKLFALFLIFFLLMNYPLLSIPDRVRFTAGWPNLFLYLFVVWSVLIGFTAWIVRRNTKP